MHLFKYIPSQYLKSFLGGAVRFQALSFFQRYENQIAIGDAFEAMRLFRPTGGLEINNLTTGQTFTLPGAFLSSALAERIFVFCASKTLSQSLAQEFRSDACVEISDFEAFLSKLQIAVAAQPGSNVLLHGAVSYYQDADPPGVNWALPDAIIMSKRDFYRRQCEYRFAFAEREVLDVGRTAQRLVTGAVQPTHSNRGAAPRELAVGDIRSISVVYRCLPNEGMHPAAQKPGGG